MVLSNEHIVLKMWTSPINNGRGSMNGENNGE
jgi:hypothetical protein